jgi:hypothetical protein
VPGDAAPQGIGEASTAVVFPAAPPFTLRRVCVFGRSRRPTRIAAQATTSSAIERRKKSSMTFAHSLRATCPGRYTCVFAAIEMRSAQASKRQQRMTRVGRSATTLWDPQLAACASSCHDGSLVTTADARRETNRFVSARAIATKSVSAPRDRKKSVAFVLTRTVSFHQNPDHFCISHFNSAFVTRFSFRVACSVVVSSPTNRRPLASIECD